MKKIIFLIPLYLITFLLAAQSSTEDRIKSVENGLTANVRFKDQATWSIHERMKHYQVPGVSIAVIKDYQLDWAKAYGLSNQKTAEKTTTETAFQAASISKTINAIGMLKWASENNIDIHTDINSLLQSWQFPYQDEQKITLANLLSHTAGLSLHGFPGYKNESNLPSTLQIIEGQKPSNNAKVKQISPPNKQFKYSGGGTTISQLILEDNQGDYATYMTENIFRPLQMNRSFYPTNFKDHVSMSHDRNGKVRKNGYNIYPELAAAALWTTPTDLAKLMIEVQLTLSGKSEKIISTETAEQFSTPWKDGQTNALGTFIDTQGDISYFQHSGGNEGFNCLYYASMEEGHGAVVMINAEKFDLIHEIMRSIAENYEWSTYLPSIIERYEEPTTKEINQFTGTYRFVDLKDRTVKVFMKKDKLYIEQKGQWKSELVPQGRNTFITDDIQPAASVTFEKDKMTIEQGKKYVLLKE